MANKIRTINVGGTDYAIGSTGDTWHGTREKYEQEKDDIEAGTEVIIQGDYMDKLPPMTAKEWKELDKTDLPDGSQVTITDDYESTICNTVQDCIDSESDDDVAGASALAELKGNTDTALLNITNKLKGNTVLKMLTFSANVKIDANSGAQVLVPFTRPSGYIPIMVSPGGCGAWSWCWVQCVLEVNNNRANCIIKSISEGGTFPVSVNVLFVKENFI